MKKTTSPVLPAIIWFLLLIFLCPVHTAWPACGDTLRINQIQAKGTHNSYHTLGFYPWFYYDMPLLEDQLNRDGIRQFEFDVHYNPSGYMKIYHAIVDPGTNYEYFWQVLVALRTWSDEHPGHQLLYVFVEPKGDSFEGHTDVLDVEIALHWPRERIFTPDDLCEPNDTSIRNAVENHGWPAIEHVRDKVMFILFDSSPVRDEYIANSGSDKLPGCLMFVRGNVGEAFTSFVMRNDPIADFEAIKTLVAADYLVRTRADEDCQEAINEDFTRAQHAIASGAQIISTDFPTPVDWSSYWFQLPNLCYKCANFNCDDIVDFFDYADLSKNWKWTGPMGGYVAGDLNCDGSIDYCDLSIFALQWLDSCP